MKQSEYKEMFVDEARENQVEINRMLTVLEKDAANKKSIEALFRITHTLKGNALGMGFEEIAALAHTLEDLFGAVKNQQLTLDENVMASLFKAVDVLSELIEALTTGKEVKYKGIKTKLDVLIKKSIDHSTEGNANPTQEVSSTSAENILAAVNSLLAQESAVAEERDKDNETEGNKITFSDSVQVPVRKLDNLLNLVGELIIEKDRIMATQNGSRSEYNRLSRVASDLQYSVMDVRLVQVGFLFNKFHRVVRDAAVLENKTVELKLNGTETEIDRNVLQVISDSLIHLIRNSIGHGIEKPEDRIKAGKPAAGTITLSSRSETDAVILEIKDDGKGIDIEKVRSKAVEKGIVTAEVAAQLSTQQITMLIFEAGFSTSDQVTAISGRGVGMDVVRKALDSIGGNIIVETEEGKGSTFRLTLPSSMAVKSALLFEMGTEKYALPLSYTDSVVSLYASDIHLVGDGLVATHLGRPISIVFLKDLFYAVTEGDTAQGKILQRSFKNMHPEQKLDIVVVSYNNKMTGLVVDKLMQQKEIVEKPLAKPVDGASFISGVTILGDGGVCLVLNVAALVNYVFGVHIKNRTLQV